MASRTERSTRRRQTTTGSQPTPNTTATADAGSQSSEADPRQMSVGALLRVVMDMNDNSAIDHLLSALSEKIPKALLEDLEAVKRARSIVIGGLPEAVRFQDRRTQLDKQVSDVLEAPLRSHTVFSRGSFIPVFFFTYTTHISLYFCAKPVLFYG
ncbi:hypothetical protein Y032_0020g176 [Ancylostoma ceylanicum]|uniref:Uncharacterized protein n=1 Tax=Ancylostoma ceylanicum TaxID=53326 RepID=A0A016V0P2_9BILA|nr:hypothetical protein Y032_0020g176 [Ancylostoma ceylanicum]